MKPDEAAAVIQAFDSAEHPACDPAVSEDRTMVGFEWLFSDGRMLIVDIHDDGSVSAAWKTTR